MRTVWLVAVSIALAAAVVRAEIVRCVVERSSTILEESVPAWRGETFTFDLQTGRYSGFFLETAPYDLTKFLDLTQRKFDFTLVSRRALSRTYLFDGERIGGVSILIINTYIHEFVLWMGLAIPSPGGITFTGKCDAP